MLHLHDQDKLLCCAHHCACKFEVTTCPHMHGQSVELLVCSYTSRTVNMIKELLERDTVGWMEEKGGADPDLGHVLLSSSDLL